MRLNLIFFSSERQDKEHIIEARRPLIDGLGAFYDVNIINSDNYAALADPAAFNNDELYVIFIAGGGTEEMFLNVFPFLKHPLIILSDGYHNSFAAATEIVTWLSNNDVEYSSYNIPLDADEVYFRKLDQELKGIYYQIYVKHGIKGMNIGLIGGESSWLIASHVNKGYISSSLQVNFTDIKITELIDSFYKIKNEKRDFSADPLFNRFKGFLTGRSSGDLENAIIMYYALRGICGKYSLNALTIKCFDLIELSRTTACLALSLLNDEGIISGCEGDIPSLLSLIMLKKGTHKPGFMANPTSSDKNSLTVDFSHCTVPLSMTESYTLPSHYETSVGIGIQGNLPAGKYSLYKIGGKNMEKYFYCAGEITGNPNLKMRCRTQVRFRFGTAEDFDRFIMSRLGNHFIIFKEDRD